MEISFVCNRVGKGMRKQIIIENNLKTLFPEIAKEWDYPKNLTLTPDSVTGKSSKKVWWICKFGHEWESTISNRTNGGNGCPYCSGRLPIRGENDFETLFPNISLEWDYEKNEMLKPSDFTASSSKKAWWKCSKGHSWKVAISSRSHGTRCPYCAGKAILPGYNDLPTLNPELAKEWNYEKNTLLPTQVTTGTNKKVWWKCRYGHEWESKIYHRHHGSGCPYCAGQKAIEGVNDLATVSPKLAKEWDYEKNSILPTEVTIYSNKKVWWRCIKGHSWKSMINNRTAGNGCPECSSETHISFAEKSVYYYVLQYYPDATENDNLGFLKRQDVDVYIESEKIAIEYDGQFWHKKKDRDIKKDILCNENGISLLRIREPQCPALNSTSIEFFLKDLTTESLNEAIKDILEKELGQKRVDIDIERDRNKIDELMNYQEKKNSLESVYPELAKEWDYQKNNPLLPAQIKYGSSKPVWWICSKGHEWKSIIHNRVLGQGCPYCSGRAAIIGENDFNTRYPVLAEEWDKELNKTNPDHYLPHSSKKIHWICKSGHRWISTIANRVEGNGCPYCSGRYAIEGETDLLSLRPDLCEEWNYEKNVILPSQVTLSSSKKVWWKCKKGHEWQAIIDNRSMKGRGCPFCAGKKLIRGVNDLGTVRPLLAEEWNYEKNDLLTPSDIMSRVAKKVWWKCRKCSYEWEAAVNNRVAGRGCPKCAGKIRSSIIV